MKRIYTLTAALGLLCALVVVSLQRAERTAPLAMADAIAARSEASPAKLADTPQHQDLSKNSRDKYSAASDIEPMPEAPAAPTTVETAEPSPLSQLPESEQASFHQALEQALLAIEPMPQEAAHLPQNADATHFAANAGQRLTARFLKNGGVRLQTGQPGMEKEATLRLKSTTASQQWHSDETRIHTTRGEITEWYQNRPEGLEHGFTIATPTHTAGPLLLPIVLENLIAREDTTRPGDLLFTDPATHAPVFAYQNLKVWDADGTVLGAHMRPTPDGFLIAVNDTSARYPITVDPLIVTMDERIDAGDPNPGYEFSRSVAIDGDTIAVGAAQYDGFAYSSGAVFVFVRTPAGWALQQKIIRHTSLSLQQFGISVDVSGNLIAVASLRTGVVDLYQRSGITWSRLHTFQAQPYNQTQYRPVVVKLTGTTLVVGCSVDDLNGAESGSIIVYQQVGAVWSEQRIIPTGGQPGDRFGESLAVTADWIAVGSPYRNFSSASPKTGRVHIYRRNGGTWVEHQALTAGASSIQDGYFGFNLALDGNTLAVTSRQTSPLLQPTVHLYTLTAGTWTPQQGIIPVTNPTSNVLSVAISNTNLVVSSNNIGAATGALFLYRRTGTTWSLIHTLHMPSTFQSSWQNFGELIDVSGNTWIASRRYDDSHSQPHGGADVFELSGNTLVHQQRLDSGKSATDAAFGRSVAIHGNMAVVGVPNADTARGTYTGAALVFVRNEKHWIRLARLHDRATPSASRFGWSVAISADTIAVGAPGYLSGKGAVFAYTRPASGGIFGNATILEKANGAAGDWFGRSVATEGNRIIAGAPKANANGVLRAGQVVVFTRSASTWSQTTLHARRLGSFSAPVDDIVADAAFGASVSISGNRIAVGAPFLNTTSPARSAVGRVYTYSFIEASGWAPAIALNPPTATGSDWFGYSVSLNSQELAVGAPEGFSDQWETWTAPQGNVRRGKVHIFRDIIGMFLYVETITENPASAFGPNFGVSVAMHGGNRLVIGAHQSGNGTGKAYLYAKNANNNWIKEADLIQTAPGTTPTLYGHSVAIHGDTIIVGAHKSNHTNGLLDAGYAYLFRITDPSAVIPALQITRSGTNAILTWPHTPGWTLHRSPTLLPGSWTPVTVTTPGTHTHPITSGTPKMFLRLQR